MSTNGVILNDQIRLELDATDLANLVTNHSGQTDTTVGWVGDSGVTLAAVTNPTRSAYSATQTLGGTYTGGKTIRATYASTAALMAETRSPSFAVVPGRYVGFTVSVADSRAAAAQALNVTATIRYYDSGSNLIAQSGSTTTIFGTRDRGENPWLMRELNSVKVSGLVPTGAVAARLGLTFVDIQNIGNVQSKISRPVYISKLMVVTSTSQESVASVPFSDTTVWQNIVGSSTSIRTSRGGDTEGVVDDIDAGLLSATVYDAALDPARNIRATFGRRIRVTVCPDANLDTTAYPFQPIWTGRITSIDTDYSATKTQTDATYRPTITITASDAVAELSSVSAPYNYGGTFSEKVRALMALTTVPFLSDGITASTTKVSLNENASVWDQLLLARNSFTTAKVFVDQSGNLVGKSFNRNAPVAAAGGVNVTFGSHTIQFTLQNFAKNPSAENANNLGATTNLTLAQSSVWAALGTYSVKLTSSSATGQKKFYPITSDGVSDTYGKFTTGPSRAFACVTVKTIVACRVALRVDTSGGTNVVSAWEDLAAGAVTTLKVDAGTVTSDHNVYVIVTKPGTDTDWDSTGDLIYVDKIGVIQGNPTAAQASAFYATPIYFDGSYVSPGIDGSSYWSGATHEALSTLKSGGIVSYTDYSAALGTKSLINSLIINRRNVSEIDNEKAYGPYLNQASIVKWGTAGAEVTVVDGDPSTLAQFYLSKFADPSVYASEITVDVTKTDAWTYKAYLAELYDTVGFQNSVSRVYGTYYVVGIDHDITPDQWTMTLRTRPIDQLYALSVGVTNGSGGLSSGPLDVIGPNGRAQELPGSVNLNNFTAPGDFAQTQNAEAASGLNYPVPQAGLLEVSMNQDQTMVWQRYTIYKNGAITEGTQWIRTFYAGAWSAWKASVATVAYTLSRFNANTSLANATWTTQSAWTNEELAGLTYSSGVWTTQVAGLYRVHFTLSFANNATGVRGVRPFINGVAGLNILSNPTSGFQTSIDVSILVRLAQGATIACQAYQSSGAALNILGDATGMYTKADIAKIGD